MRSSCSVHCSPFEISGAFVRSTKSICVRNNSWEREFKACHQKIMPEKTILANEFISLLSDHALCSVQFLGEKPHQNPRDKVINQLTPWPLTNDVGNSAKKGKHDFIIIPVILYSRLFPIIHLSAAQLQLRNNSTTIKRMNGDRG